MTTTTEPTLDQVLDLAARLTAADKLRVIERLAHDIVPSVQSDPMPPPSTESHRTLWAQLQASMRDLPTPRPTLAAQLERDRAERDQSLGSG